MPNRRSSSFVREQLKSFFALFLFIQSARSFVIRPGSFSLVGRPGHGNDEHHCADSPLWEYRGDQEPDCLEAIRMLHDSEVRKHGDNQFEFVPDGDHPHLSLAVTKTPRKYIYSEWPNSPVLVLSMAMLTVLQRKLHRGDCESNLSSSE